jgi:hypothetical protein
MFFTGAGANDDVHTEVYSGTPGLKLPVRCSFEYEFVSPSVDGGRLIGCALGSEPVTTGGHQSILSSSPVFFCRLEYSFLNTLQYGKLTLPTIPNNTRIKQSISILSSTSVEFRFQRVDDGTTVPNGLITQTISPALNPETTFRGWFKAKGPGAYFGKFLIERI